MLGSKRNVLTLFPITLLLAAMFVVLPVPIFADPPAFPPNPDVILPKVFCFRITDIRADKSDPTPDINGDPNRFIFEFEVLNWSNQIATDVHLSLAEPDTSGVRFVAAGVDSDGRPLFPEDFNMPPGVGPEDLEDTDGDGELDMGEDQNADGRLTNDPIPGNLGYFNEFEVIEQTDTNIIWDAGGELLLASFPLLQPAYAGEFDGIFNIDLLGLSGSGDGDTSIGQAAVNNAIPGELGVDYTIDGNGNVLPPEAIDNGGNVRDGFTFTIDDLDEGETFQLNWFLSQFGEPIGSTFGGNSYGFGVINIARSDDANFPGPIYVGNTGFQQSPLEFFDSVYVVPDPAGIGVEFGAGLTAPFINPDDNIGGPTNTVLFQIGGSLMPVDTTTLMLLGIQGTASWIIPVLVSAIGIGIVIVSRKTK